MDWTNPKAKISKYFTVHELCWLPTWGRLATEQDGLNTAHKNNLLYLAQTLDKIRILLNKPMIVHVAYRPPVYNSLVKGAKRSAHLEGKACDFHVVGMTCDEVRAKLIPKLTELRIRLEDLPGSNWVHIDTRVTPTDGLKQLLFKVGR